MNKKSEQIHRKQVERFKKANPKFVAKELERNRADGDAIINELIAKGLSVCPCIKGDILRDYDNPGEICAALNILARFAAVEIERDESSSVAAALIALTDHVLTRLDEVTSDDTLDGSELEVNNGE